MTLAPVPSDIPSCFERVVPKPAPGPKTEAEIIKLVGQLKKSELEKSLCGKRLITWYEAQAGVFNEE